MTDPVSRGLKTVRSLLACFGAVIDRAEPFDEGRADAWLAEQAEALAEREAEVDVAESLDDTTAAFLTFARSTRPSAAHAAGAESPEAVSARIPDIAAPASGHPDPCDCGHRIHDSNVCPVGECLCVGWFPNRDSKRPAPDKSWVHTARERSKTSAVAPPAAVDDPEMGVSPAPVSGVADPSIVAIKAVLACHQPCETMTGHGFTGGVACIDVNDHVHAELADWQDWRDHVAPIIADRISGPPPRPIGCVVDDCPETFTSYELLNSHSYWMHQEADPFNSSDDPRITYRRYPGATESGDFKWFGLKITAPINQK